VVGTGNILSIEGEDLWTRAPSRLPRLPASHRWGEQVQPRVFDNARWYAVRPAANRKPSTYRCPLCGELLPALGAHILVVPEGVPARRRHAHTECVVRARKAGRLPLREEVEPPRPGLLARLRRRA
jgi:hypothetical protein